MIKCGFMLLKQLPLNFAHILLPVNSIPGVRVLLGGVITSLDNPLDFHSIINSLGDPYFKIFPVLLIVLKYLYTG